MKRRLGIALLVLVLVANVVTLALHLVTARDLIPALGQLAVPVLFILDVRRRHLQNAADNHIEPAA